MHVLVTGASGLLGSALVHSLRAQGHSVRRLGRGDRADHVWDPDHGVLPPAAVSGIDAVVHLAGASIAGRWTASRRRAIRDSRIVGTRLLCERLTAQPEPPKTLLSASAVGYYGDRADTPLPEDSESGTGFLAETCLEWERATASAAERGLRVVLLRFGIVLAASGGALPRLLPVFRAGLGGRLGNGRQYMSWILLDDAVAAIEHALTTPLRGAVNVVAPEQVTNAMFTRTLARVLGRPALLPVPAPLLRLLLGSMAEETLLASARAVPQVLQAAGFQYRAPTLEAALRQELGQPGA